MITKLFEEQVKRHPNQLAIKTEHHQITYNELNQAANRVAREIIHEAEDNKTMGLLFEHGTDMIIGMMSALKAGKIYVPLDATYPLDRLAYIMDDAEISTVVTNSQNMKHIDPLLLEAGKPIKVINIDTLSDLLSSENLNVPIPEDQIAYLLYTSGSTGRPKGVIQSRENVVYFVKNYINDFSLTPNDRLTLFSAFGHDAAVMDIYGGLLSGATLYPVNLKNKIHMRELVKWLIEERITVWHSVPTVFRYFYQNLVEGEQFPDLRLIILGGEQVLEHDVQMFKKFFTRPTCLANLYGQSESSYNSVQMITIDSPFKKVTLGQLTDGMEILLIDEDGMEVGELGKGEILVVSNHVALGYWKDEERTEKAFGYDPDLGRFYWTGDLGRLTPDGTIEFLGRKDFQIKIRGYRVELAEIESLLLQHEDVKEAVVIVKEEEMGEKVLCACIVPKNKEKHPDIRSYVSQKVPDYMVPSHVLILETMPLTSTNKVDRTALLHLEFSQTSQREYLPPRDAIEEKLTEIWAELLGVERVGIHDHFFELGGHSLKATSLISRIYREFEVEIALKEVFDRPTIQELAEYIRSAEKTTYLTIEKAEDREFYPVSAAQRRMFVLNQLESDNISYNLPGAVIIEGQLDQQRLEDAFTALIQRHESLRTSFEIVENELVQRVHPEVDFSVNYLQVEESKIAETLSGLIQPFDLSKAPLLRVTLLECGPKKILAFDMYHIISDGISREILFKEFLELYEGNQLPELRLQYRDFAIWQNHLLQSTQFKKYEEYWLDQFLEERTQREIPVLHLPYDYSRPAKQSFAGDRVEFTIGEVWVRQLHELAQVTNSTLYICLLALFNVLLANYSGQEDIIVGTPIAGRPNAELEKIIGMFVNTLALRNYPEANKTFREFLTEVRERTLTAFENQYYQFDALIDQLHLARDMSRNPLFDTMFRLQNHHDTAIPRSELQCSLYKFENKISQFDLQLTCVEIDGKIECTFEYATKLFQQETIKQMSKHFTQLMQDVLHHPDKLLADVEIFTAEEKATLLDTLNDTKVDYAKEKVIHQLFEEQAVKTPEQIAVIAGEKSLTYRELNERANQLANFLREKGVQRETIVGLMVERSVEMMVGILGVLKAGGAYLPMDPAYPVERIEYMLADSEAQVLLTQSTVLDQVKFAGEQICLDDATIFTGQVCNVHNVNHPSDLIYLIYTSGSTGKPKGTMLEHRSVNNFITGINEVIPFSVNKTVLSLTTVSFDIFVLETLLPLTSGAGVVLATEDEQRDFNRIVSLILENKVNLIQFTPSRLQLLLEQEQAQKVLGELTEILVGGEAFPEALLRKLQDLTNARIFNMYGPTETTVWSTIKELTQTEKVSIGKPLANTQIYLLNQNLKLVPPRVIGELYIAGDGLARGYYKQIDLTNERFVENPYAPGKKMYRTGDLARLLADGNIEFMGRKDHQVKLRGYRIETGEIEFYLNQYTGIKESVVVVRKLEDGSSDLVGYYVANEGIPVSELRSHLLKTLPDYMVPTWYHLLTQLPLTPNGKIDRKALPAVEGNRPYLEQKYQAPETEIEKVVTDLCKETLKIDLVGVHDNFFDLGGNSMLIVQMHRKLNHVFPGQITIGDIFAYPTVAKLSEHLESKTLLLQNNSEEEYEFWIHELQEPIELLTLPLEDRSTEKGAKKENLLRFPLKAELTQRLVEIAQQEKIDVYDILVGMYIYLFSQMMSKTDVIIAATRKDETKVFPIRIQFEELQRIQDLFTMVRVKLEKVAQMQMDPIQTMLKERMDEGTFLPLFSSRYDINFSPYEFILHAEVSQGDIAFGCRYQSMFKRTKVEELMKKYVKLIEIMIHQYFSVK